LSKIGRTIHDEEILSFDVSDETLEGAAVS
jgi:hypothetical protein